MRRFRVSARLLGVVDTVVVSSRFDVVNNSFVVKVRPSKWAMQRCGRCGCRCVGYDRGRHGPRRWRSTDVGVVACYLEAELPRVRCPDHGVVTSWVPWARHGAGHTRVFDKKVAWLATRMSKTAIAHYLGITWSTVGQIIARVMADIDAQTGDRFTGLRRIGIDEISYKRGFKYLTVVVDHDSRLLLWAAEGRSKHVLARFFAALGEQRCAQIELVSADAADWIFQAVQEHCPKAKICLDPFHVVVWATRALDEVRRGMWRAIRRSGQRHAASDLRGARYALLKNPNTLTQGQQVKLAEIQQTNKPLYRAYLLKEQLRMVFATAGGAERASLLNAWLHWAARCRIAPFVDLARRIRLYYRGDIINTLTYRLSNGLIESTNTKIRLLTRMAFGFKSVDALIALAKLHLGGYQIELPGRA